MISSPNFNADEVTIYADIYRRSSATLSQKLFPASAQTFTKQLMNSCFEESVLLWVEWSHRHGLLVRYEAHGSPGNLLDLYAAADIPESKTFGPDWLLLAGVKPLEGTPLQRGQVDPKTLLLINKFASSAANVSGKKTVL